MLTCLQNANLDTLMLYLIRFVYYTYLFTEFLLCWLHISMTFLPIYWTPDLNYDSGKSYDFLVEILSVYTPFFLCNSQYSFTLSSLLVPKPYKRNRLRVFCDCSVFSRLSTMQTAGVWFPVRWIFRNHVNSVLGDRNNVFYNLLHLIIIFVPSSHTRTRRVLWGCCKCLVLNNSATLNVS